MANRSDAAAAIGLLFLLIGCDSGDASPGEGPATSLQGCPTPPEFAVTDEFDEPYADLPDEVPDGAVAARICEGGGMTRPVPADVLTTSVDELVDAVNALPHEENGACTSEAGPGYRILFDYEDGSTFLISAGFFGCEWVIVGNGRRGDPQQLTDTWVELVREQRAHSAPPDIRADPFYLRCDVGGGVRTFVELADPAEITSANVCAYAYDSDRVLQASVPPAALDRLVADLRTPTSVAKRRCPMRERHRTSVAIIAATAWGDYYTVSGECGHWELPSGESWEPDPASERILDRLVSEARPFPRPDR